ncbi:MAG TPA: DNA polymerase ligase N-terminal domain-containing protein [Candidatus Thermoplasmatota archaeon]|nr:DNA polymerase ligase N-terminal domain-containing protein [Candidatus Thermoplasmatota archaeon]
MRPEDEVAMGLDPRQVLRGWKRPVYMVHDHHSRSHHHDLRLEFEGVLRSWAVPKGLSAEPGVKRLAMQVPDHALSYAPFEGEIPEGSYGAGKVGIWDRGTFKVLEETPDKLVLDIQGQRIKGVYHMVRAALNGNPRSWLVSLEAPPVPSSKKPVKKTRRQAVKKTGKGRTTKATTKTAAKSMGAGRSRSATKKA